MTFTGFDGSGMRMRGGIRSLRLIPATQLSGAYTDDRGHLTISLLQGTQPVGIGFSEDSASYSEDIATVRGTHICTHTLKFRFGSGGYGASQATGSLSAMSRSEGIVALIETEAGEYVLAGYSSRFGTERPLKLSVSTATSAKSPVEAPYTELTLISSDSTPAPTGINIDITYG